MTGALGLANGLGAESWRSPLAYRAVVVAVWALSGLAYLTVPPSPDQFEFDYMGWRMLEGDVPYRDFIDMNWPGGMWLHALSTALFGNHIWSWRALDFLLTAASAWPLAKLVEDAGGPGARRILLLLYPVLYAALPQWISGQTDTSGGQFLIGCLACHAYAHTSGRLRMQALTGLLLALAMLNKPTLGILGALLPLAALLARQHWVGIIRHTAVAGIASVVTLLVAFGCVLLQGATEAEVTDAVYVYNVETQFADVTPVTRLISTWATVHFVWWHFVSLGGLGTAAFLLVRGRRSFGALSLMMLWLASVASFFIQRKWYQYHLSVCFFALAALLSVGLGMLVQSAWSSRRGGLPALAVGALVALGSLKKLEGNYRALPRALAGWDFREHWSRFQEGESLTVASAVDLVRYVRSVVPAGETLYVFGSASSINFLGERRQPTRFFYAPVIKTAVPPLPMAAEWIAQFQSDLERGRPKLCLIEQADLEWLSGPTRPAQVLTAFLQARYRRIGALHPNATYRLYERR